MTLKEMKRIEFNKELDNLKLLIDDLDELYADNEAKNKHEKYKELESLYFSMIIAKEQTLMMDMIDLADRIPKKLEVIKKIVMILEQYTKEETK